MKKRSLNPVEMIAISIVLLLLGVVLPFLMVMQVLKSTFFLNFFSYGASVIGLFLGTYGVFGYIKTNQK